MRVLTSITILFAAACSSAPKPAPTTTTAWQGSIDGQSFVARSALMTEVNAQAKGSADGRAVTVSTIYVFERVVSCGEIANAETRHRLTLAEKEHGVQIDVIGAWPRGRGVLATAKEVDAAVQSGTSRTDVQGTVTILEATPWSGTISLDLKNQADGVRGDVRFTVCR